MFRGALGSVKRSAMARITLECDAVLFDLDGVLVDSSAVVERTWRRWSVSRSLHVPDIVQRAHGRRSIDTIRDVAPHLDAQAEAHWLADAELSDFDGVVALPGASELLNGLGDNQRAVVTSGGRALARSRLEYVRLPVPRVLIAAEDVHKGKPSPEGYLMAAERLGVPASRCAVFEDAPAGVKAAASAGATVIGVATNFAADELAAASCVIDSLASVRVFADGELILEVNA